MYSRQQRRGDGWHGATGASKLAMNPHIRKVALPPFKKHLTGGSRKAIDRRRPPGESFVARTGTNARRLTRLRARSSARRPARSNTRHQTRPHTRSHTRRLTPRTRHLAVRSHIPKTALPRLIVPPARPILKVVPKPFPLIIMPIPARTRTYARRLTRLRAWPSAW